MTPRTAHFYHLWADGHWKVPVHEHLRALRDSRYSGSVHIGIVGTPVNRDDAMRYVTKFWSPAVDWCASADTGFEQVTLSALRAYAHQPDAAPYVLYAHTKGAYEESVPRDAWREAMTEPLVRHWEFALPLLERHDAVGLHWLTPAEFPKRQVGSPFFGGNFWWATTAYLRTLPAPGTGSRFDAEAWIGLGSPKVADLRPGWPPYDREYT
jgi:hypothetical protein